MSGIYCVMRTGWRRSYRPWPEATQSKAGLLTRVAATVAVTVIGVGIDVGKQFDPTGVAVGPTSYIFLLLIRSSGCGSVVGRVKKLSHRTGTYARWGFGTGRRRPTHAVFFMGIY